METKAFYDKLYAESDYCRETSRVSDKAFYSLVRQFVDTYDLRNRHCLEVGCGRGMFQDLVEDYVGTDLSDAVGRYFHKPFVQCSATSLPFDDNSFDAAWTVDTLEHVLDPCMALDELVRVVRPNGVVLVAPAWHTRPWFAEGLPVRPYRDLGWKDRLRKVSIVFRDLRALRFPYMVFRRASRLLSWRLNGNYVPLRYRSLRANLEKFWMPDSDACNSFDQLDFVLWFVSRGHECLLPRSTGKWILYREKGLMFRIQKPRGVRNA